VCFGPTLTDARARQSLLVAGKLQEAPKVVLGERLERSPEEADVRVRVRKAHVAHRVLAQKGKIDVRLATDAQLKVLALSAGWVGHRTSV
jgi:hypothetical protein